MAKQRFIGASSSLDIVSLDESGSIGRRQRRFLEERLGTAIWWRRARISAWRTRRDRKLKTSVEIKDKEHGSHGLRSYHAGSVPGQTRRSSRSGLGGSGLFRRRARSCNAQCPADAVEQQLSELGVLEIVGMSQRSVKHARLTGAW
jgi:hypothetical protein